MTKISEDDLKEINDLRLKINKSIGEAGQATLQIKMLQEDIKKLEKDAGKDLSHIE